MTFLLIVTFLVIVISAMCSLFEAVLYSVPVTHIETLVSQGRPSGRVLRKLRRDVDGPISAILSLNTISNTAGAAIAGAAVARVFGLPWLPYFSAGLTLAILILSEVVPKTAGVVFAKRLASKIAYPLQLLVWVMAPLVLVCRLATRLIKRGSSGPSVSEEELIVMARLGLQAGSIEAEEAEVIQNILALERKTAREVMTPRSVMFAVPLQSTADEARNLSGMLTHSRWPVYDKNMDDVLGVVHRREVLSAVADGRNDTPIAKLMKPVQFVADAMPLDRLLRFFLERREHLAMVIDEHGGIAGLISLEDILEEILGQEIVDETDIVADMRELARRRREKILKKG